MKSPKVLMNLGLSRMLAESTANTQTGQSIINKYTSYLMGNPESFSVVNSLFKECVGCQYDNGINKLLEGINNYISQNRTLWAIGSACESIQATTSPYAMLNRNAARQAEKLLEMSEEDAVKYIRSGVLKNVMYCEQFRNIAKSIFRDRPVVEHTARFTRTKPVSMVENVGDGYCFVVEGRLYKMDNAKNIQECNEWQALSNTFIQVSKLISSPYAEINENTITIHYGNAEYVIESQDRCTYHRGDVKKDMTTQQVRENNRLTLMATSPARRNEVASVLESVALVCENYDSICDLDNVSVYITNSDKFVVIESGNNLYASLYQSNHSGPWSINENAVEALKFIKKNTRVDLTEEYHQAVEGAIKESEEAKGAEIKKQLEQGNITKIREKIEELTEKWKNDPVKLAVLSKLATEVSEF